MPVEIGVGMPEWLYLNEFGRAIRTTFGVSPYLVGSALVGKEWRDVDVRLILDDEAAIFNIPDGLIKLGEKNSPHTSWAYLCAAFSELGRKMTGLPIDFQIQTLCSAIQYKGRPKHALGLKIGESPEVNP